MKNGEEEWQVSLEFIDTLWNVNHIYPMRNVFVLSN